jgi:hypothetical protein
MSHVDRATPITCVVIATAALTGQIKKYVKAPSLLGGGTARQSRRGSEQERLSVHLESRDRRTGSSDQGDACTHGNGTRGSSRVVQTRTPPMYVLRQEFGVK